MAQSKFLKAKNPLTDKANLDELNYKEKHYAKDPRVDSWEKHVTTINDGRLEYAKVLVDMGLPIRGIGIELGSGTSWLTSEISKNKAVKKIYCLDFSEHILKKVVPKIIDYFGGDCSKIIRMVGDFNRLDFKDNYFDFILVDAALHHANDLVFMLKESNRVLKKGGVLVAIREPITPKLRPWAKREFGKCDREQGATENMYSKEEWIDYFEKAGFKLEMIPYIPVRTIASRKSGLKRFLANLMGMVPFKWLNGYLFSHYILVARKAN